MKRLILMSSLFGPLLIHAMPQKTCLIKYKEGSVASVSVPMGAATTIKFSEDIVFAHNGNAGDFNVIKLEGMNDTLVVSATNVRARPTSFTVMTGNKDKKKVVALWLKPVAQNIGCTVLEIKKGSFF